MRYAIVRVHSNDKSDYIIMHAPTWTVTAVSAVAQLIRALIATREYKQKVTSRLKTCQAEHSCARLGAGVGGARDILECRVQILQKRNQALV